MRIIKTIGKKIKKNVSNIVATVGGCITSVGLYTVNTYANGDVGSITKPIGMVLDILEYIVVAIGAIILLKNIMETAQAYQQQDSSSMHSGLKGIAAGSVMVAAGTIMRLLGIGH